MDKNTPPHENSCFLWRGTFGGGTSARGPAKHEAPTIVERAYLFTPIRCPHIVHIQHFGNRNHLPASPLRPPFSRGIRINLPTERRLDERVPGANQLSHVEQTRTRKYLSTYFLSGHLVVGPTTPRGHARSCYSLGYSSTAGAKGRADAAFPPLL